MSKYSIISACCLSVLACSLLASQAKAPSGQWEHLFEGSRILAGKDRAWIVQEPRVASTGIVEEMLFGPGPNEAVMLLRPAEVQKPEEALGPAGLPPLAKGSLLQIVNLTNGSARFLNLPAELSPITSIGWVNEGRVLMAYCGVGDSSKGYLIDLVGGGSYSSGGSEENVPYASSVPSVVLLFGEDKTKTDKSARLQIVDFSSGAPRVRDYPVPAKFAEPILLTKNLTVFGAAFGGGMLELNLSDGSTKTWTSQDGMAEVHRQLGAENESKLQITFGTEKWPGLFLAAEPGLRSKHRLSKEADTADISSQENRVLFIAHGVAFVSDLTPINLEAAIKSLTEKAIEKAKFIAKQNGTAALFYAADYDDALPFSAASARDGLYPYLKNSVLADKIIWTNLTGQRIDRINDPSKTELGYVLGPGGRAIVYADSSVRWRPDP